MIPTYTLEELIEWCRDFVFFNGALDQEHIDKHKMTVNAIASRLLAAQEMAEALISVSPQKDGLSFNVANKVINALAAWDGKCSSAQASDGLNSNTVTLK